MPIVILILLIVLIAQFGFWNTLGSVLGAVGVLILLALTIAALAAMIFAYAYQRIRQKI